jgi:hypothetical protein
VAFAYSGKFGFVLMMTAQRGASCLPEISPGLDFPREIAL